MIPPWALIGLRVLRQNLLKKEVLAVGGIAVLALLLYRAKMRVKELEGLLAARPAVTERVVTKTVQGPTRIEYRTIIKPGGERIVERIRVIESQTVEREATHLEMPICAPQPTRKKHYAGIALNPYTPGKPRLRSGFTIYNVIDVGTAYDLRLTPQTGALQLEVGVRF